MANEDTESFLARLLANPVARGILVSWLMRGLGMLGAVLAAKGYLTPAQASAIDWNEVAGSILVIASFYYGTRKTYTTQQKIVTSIANPQVETEAELEQVIKNGGAASVTTPKTSVPAPL